MRKCDAFIYPRTLKLLILLVVLFLVGVGVYMAVQIPKPHSPHGSLHALGLANPVSNRLNQRYADADGDLVADTPEDPFTGSATGGMPDRMPVLAFIT